MYYSSRKKILYKIKAHCLENHLYLIHIYIYITEKVKNIKFFKNGKKKACIFISGNGSNLNNLIKKSREYNFPIKIN